MAVAVRRDTSVAANGGPTEAGELFERHSERLLAFCLHMLRSRPEAEDAVQTTFLYAHRALQRGVVPESEYAWLHSIARNVCRWQLRTAARRARGLADADIDAIAASGSGGEDGRELSLGLTEALATIPEGQRRALLLREWHGLSSSEVASQLGMSAPATYALLTRARRSLARAMASRPALSLNFGPLLAKLKGLFTGGVASAAASTAVVAGLAVGGVSVGKALQGADQAPATPTVSLQSEPGFAARNVAVVSRSAMVPVGVERAGARVNARPVPAREIGGTATPADDPAPASGSQPSASAGVMENPSPPPSWKPEPSPFAEDPPGLPLPPELGLPDLPVIEDLPVVGDLLPPGEGEDGSTRQPGDVVEDVVAGAPDVPLPDVELPPLP